MSQFNYDSASLLAAAQDAEAAANVAKLTREDLRWKGSSDDPARQQRIEDALRGLDEAMRPVRSAIGRFVWEPVPEPVEQALRTASTSVQYERKQLKKMRR